MRTCLLIMTLTITWSTIGHSADCGDKWNLEQDRNYARDKIFEARARLAPINAKRAEKRRLVEALQSRVTDRLSVITRTLKQITTIEKIQVEAAAIAVILKSDEETRAE